jgi:hypothetical protein
MAYTTGINENLLVKGAADVAPKFAGYSKEIGRFKENLNKNALLRQKQLDVEKTENELRSKQYLSIDNVDTAGLGTDVLGSTTAYATDVKNKAFDLIKNKSNLGVTEFNVQYSSLLKEIEGLNGMNKIKKALGTQYIESMKNGDAAPWANSPNQELIQLAVDQDIKDKKWIKKDGKFLLSVTKDGKTTDINLADLKPVETSDPSIFLTIEDQARKRLKASSLTPGSLTPERVRSVAEKTVLGLTDEQAKNAALYYVLTNVETGAKLSKEAQVKYFTPPPGVPPEQHMFKIRKDVENILYDRELIAYGVDLNKSKMPKPTTPDNTDKKRGQTERKRVSDLNVFMQDFEQKKSEFNIGRNKAGVFTGQINLENPNIDKAFNEINYEIVEKFATSEDDPTLESITVKKIGEPDSRAIQILPNESAQVFARKLFENRGATPEEAYRYGYQFTTPIDYSQYKEQN